jgi:AhpD family alkylhydroperoxidase
MIMQARMQTPALALPGAMEALMALYKAIEQSGVSRATLELTNMRASQINGCSVCVDLHFRMLKKLGETDERIVALGAWREAPYYTDAERAALALAEAVTRLSDRADPVPDEIWNQATQHFDEATLGALVMSIGLINLWNRLNAATRQVGGEWVARHV